MWDWTRGNRKATESRNFNSITRSELNEMQWDEPRREWVTAIQLIQPTSFHAFNWNEEGINEFQHEWPKAWRINSINHFISPNLRRMKRDWMKSQQCKRGSLLAPAVHPFILHSITWNELKFEWIGLSEREQYYNSMLKLKLILRKHVADHELK